MAIRKELVAMLCIFLIITLPICLADEYALVYDANGNLITGDGKFREYNEFNQLIRVRAGYDENGRILEEYLWHPVEERILFKKVYEYNFGGWWWLKEQVVYVDENFIEVDNVSAPTKYYIYAKDETGIVAEQRVGGEKLFYHGDHLGSTTLITNSSGQIVENTFYEPFGGIVSGGSRRYDYEGKEFSSATNDYDFHFRKYDSGLKIFTQPDSILPDIYNPQTLNRYAFENNNPYKNKDETGHFIQALPLVVLVLGIYVIGSFSQAVANAKLEEAKKKGDKEEIRKAQMEFYISPIASSMGVLSPGSATISYLGLWSTLTTVWGAWNLLHQPQETYTATAQHRNDIINQAIQSYENRVGEVTSSSPSHSVSGSIVGVEDPFDFKGAIVRWLEKNPGKKEELRETTKYK